MDINITPTKLKGTVNAVPGKSHSHRLLIANALSKEPAIIDNLQESEDINASKEALNQLNSQNPQIFCGESGSTLRFLLPVTMALKNEATFSGNGKLPQRPISPLKEELEKHGCKFTMGNGQKICSINGKMRGGDFYLAGNISSQFVTGLLFALPLTKEGGTIHMTSPLESKSYVDMTMDILLQYGIKVESTGNSYKVFGNQSYIAPQHVVVEGDWSAAAFWIVANSLGSEINCIGLNSQSTQGDKDIYNIVKNISNVKTIDGKNIPDLIPILAVLAAVTPGKREIINAGRLRIKESDRLKAIYENLKSLGADVKELDSGLTINGNTKLNGGSVKGFNDHRIVMSMAIAATVCEKSVTISDAQSVSKSYPHFFEDYKALGGKINEINFW